MVAFLGFVDGLRGFVMAGVSGFSAEKTKLVFYFFVILLHCGILLCSLELRTWEGVSESVLIGRAAL
jgi:uncharacterized membrane protein YtjA (UPF0391 family)